MKTHNPPGTPLLDTDALTLLNIPQTLADLLWEADMVKAELQLQQHMHTYPELNLGYYDDESF
jgi:hypothetical protein